MKMHHSVTGMTALGTRQQIYIPSSISSSGHILPRLYRKILDVEQLRLRFWSIGTAKFDPNLRAIWHVYLLTSALCLAVALLAGCSSSPRVTFYTLNVAATNEAPAPPLNSVAIGPITLPDLLDRPQLVVRTAANQVDILETHRWAESLKSGIPRTIAADLAILLKPARVSSYPQNAGVDAGYRVLLDIQRFEMTAGAGVGLEALWSVRTRDGVVSRSGRTVVSEPVGAAGYDALVAAQSRALAALSRDLARALGEVARAAQSQAVK